MHYPTLILCLISALGNQIPGSFLTVLTGIPLYLDTLFTVAVFFSLGLIPALITGVFLHILLIPAAHIFIYRTDTALLTWNLYIFVLCIVVEIFLVYFFHKRWLKHQEAAFLASPSLHSFLGMAPLLLMLAVLACVVVSITGGIIDLFITHFTMPRPQAPEDIFKIGLLRNNMPFLASAILSRIPINIVDRFFVIFGGYAISLLYRKWLAILKVR